MSFQELTGLVHYYPKNAFNTVLDEVVDETVWPKSRFGFLDQTGSALFSWDIPLANENARLNEDEMLRKKTSK